MTTASSDLLLMLLSDARLPVAGHTQSAGLEPALREGLTDVPAYLRLRLRTVTRVEAGTAVVAMHHVRAGRPLGPVEAAWAARTPSPAMRTTSHQLARGLLRLAGALWPLADLAAPSSRPVVLGAVGAAVGLSPPSLARLVGYDDVQTVSAAALKLTPLNPAQTTRWVLDALPQIDLLAAEVAVLTAPDEIPASSAPQIEQWAERHAVATRRLFSA
ncbi:MAG: putative urease accessory protein [Frankiales bacterium]|jgi:urease accessory protein|nr:putative urease accessory protein [Frankiales bacterium]